MSKLSDKTTEYVISKYESACQRLVREFCYKQGVEFDFWLGDEIGSCFSVNCDAVLTLSDILFDLKTNQPKGKIFNWYWSQVSQENPVSYKKYCEYL